jgi:aspartyl-tRNA(Asn)/glutamyl-tRNA(Gln) amidotransferase subunit C
MSTITTDDVLGLAQLSNIQLSDEEVDSLKTDITSILAYIDMLGELDTEGVEPTYQVNGLSNVFRADEVNQSAVTRESLLAVAPEVLDNQVKVPKVL